MDRFVIEDFTLSVVADNKRKSLVCYLKNKDGVVISPLRSFPWTECYLKNYFGFISDEDI